MAEHLAALCGLSRVRGPRETFSTVSAYEDKSLVSKFQIWFQNLSPGDRSESLILTHKPLAQLLCQMQVKKLKEGEGSFSLLETALSDSLEDSLYFHRSASAVRTEEWEFERELRVFDAQSYLDSVTVTETLTQGTMRLMELSAAVSEGKAFTQAICATLRPEGDWQWDFPQWFNASFFSLSQLALALLEQTAWKSYWKSAKANPGKVSGSAIVPIATGSSGASGIKRQLVDYWKTLKRSTRARVLGDLKDLFLTTKEASSKRLSTASSYSHGKDFSQYLTSGFAPHKHYTVLSAERAKFEEADSVNSLADLPSERLFTTLFYSQLHRAGTTFDQVCRQVVIRVRTAYTLHEANATLKKLRREAESDGSSSDSSLFIQDPVFHSDTFLEDEE